MSDKTTGDNVMALPMKVKGSADVASLTPGQIMEQVLAKGNLEDLNEGERNRYYVRVCESLGLNPLTVPLQYIKLNGRLVLYANKDCAAQLRKIHGISIEDITLEEVGGVYVFIAKAKDRDGRLDVGRGAVSVKGLQGEALANAIMKGETKAKRRVTLSLAGLGFLDETEIDDIQSERKSSAEGKRDGTVKKLEQIRREIQVAPDCQTLSAVAKDHSKELDAMPERWLKVVSDEFIYKWSDLGGEAEECPMLPMEERG